MDNGINKLGIDIGSTTVKVALLSEDNEILYSEYKRHYANIRETLKELIEKAYEKTGDINSVQNKTPFLEIPDKKNTKIILVKVIDQNYFEGHLRLKNNLGKMFHTLSKYLINSKLSNGNFIQTYLSDFQLSKFNIA